MVEHDFHAHGGQPALVLRHHVAVVVPGRVHGQDDEGEDPGVVAGHGAAAPEDVQQRVLVDPPGGERGGPAAGPLDLDLGHGEEIAEQPHPEEQEQQGAAVAADHGVAPGLPSTVASTSRAASGRPRRRAFSLSWARAAGSASR